MQLVQETYSDSQIFPNVWYMIYMRMKEAQDLVELAEREKLCSQQVQNNMVQFDQER